MIDLPMQTPMPSLTGLSADGEVDLERVLEAVVDQVTRALDCERATLFLVDHARGELVSRVAHLPEMTEIRVRIGEGVAGWVARSGQAVNMPAGGTDPHFTGHIDAQTGYHTENLLAVPIRGSAGVVGVIQVLNQRQGAFEGRDTRRLTALADEVAALLESTSLRSQLHPSHDRPLAFRFNHIIGESPAMRAAYDRVSRAARTEATVLVLGESGTGKELFARAIHVNSPRRKGPFVKVDCAALPTTLIENELFGHEKGAFTGADRARPGKVQAAEGGTLFLDEVGELPLEVQGKLLRLIQDRTFLQVGGNAALDADVRFVCATHRDLGQLVADGKFRADLYYRLKVVPIEAPPLRTRGSADLDRLIDHFLFELSRRHGRPDLVLSRGARGRLHGHHWPGNVRELEHCIESAVVLAPGQIIEGAHLSISGDVADVARSTVEMPRVVVSGAEDFTTSIKSLKDVEQAYVAHVLEVCGGNRSEAARRLGIGRNTLLRKLRGG
ncbi:MAG: sigma 54-interacting transcriptional regulator [Bradymonadia bacterium]